MPAGYLLFVQHAVIRNATSAVTLLQTLMSQGPTKMVVHEEQLGAAAAAWWWDDDKWFIPEGWTFAARFDGCLVGDILEGEVWGYLQRKPLPKFERLGRKVES